MITLSHVIQYRIRVLSFSIKINIYDSYPLNTAHTFNSIIIFACMFYLLLFHFFDQFSIYGEIYVYIFVIWKIDNKEIRPQRKQHKKTINSGHIARERVIGDWLFCVCMCVKRNISLLVVGFKALCKFNTMRFYV